MRGRLAVLVAAALLAAAPALAQHARLVYPDAPRGDAVDTYWGTAVADPYRPLESVDAPRTQAWLAAEHALTRASLDAIPQRAAIRAAFAAFRHAAASETALERHGQFWSRSRTEPGKRAVTYVRDAYFQPERVLFDDDALPANVTVAYTVWSTSGRLFAYGTQTNGSDWLTWRVRDVLTGADLPDVLRWSKFVDVSFAGDDGFYYSGYDAPAGGREDDGAPLGGYKAFYHRLGTPQAADLLVAAAAPGSNAFPATRVTPDGAYALVITGLLGANGFDVFPAERPDAPRRTLVAPSDGPVRYAGNAGSRFYFRTNAGAPNGKIVEVDAGDPQRAARTLVPERADPLVDASLVGDRLFLSYLHDVHSVIAIADREGRAAGSIALPGLGTATVPTGDAQDGYADYTYTSFTVPLTTYRYDLADGKSTVVARDPVPFDPAPYVSEQLFATSRDGTRVPVFVTRRRDVRYDGSTPTLLYGYAAYGDLFTLTPSFGTQIALWLKLGGAYAVVNARGGGEYGEGWHRAGMLASKQHSFDDVIAAAEMLIARKLTSPRKLALRGGSMGGLLVGAAITQRPDLFAAALPEAGVLDMLRVQKFTIGAGLASETGLSDRSEAAFRTLLAYSPLHNVRAGTRYPAVLVTTGDHDDRVFPAHSYKFAAALQRAQAGDAPILLRVEANAGHDDGTTGSAYDTVADRFAFLVRALEVNPTLP
jgi:prolyl oligopeptidase